MKILMVNKFHYIKGGSETYYFALKRLLQSKGHDVIDFSMKDEKNFESQYSDYFVDNIDYNNVSSIKEKIKIGVKLIYSVEAKKKFEELVIAVKPDVVHLHIFQHQISLSILDVIKKYKIPTVYTAHDLQMICPNYRMLSNGDICEDCKGGKYYKCTMKKCIKDSSVKSVLGTFEAYLNEVSKRYNIINHIITPSRFYKNKFIEFGINEKRITHLCNFLDREKPVIHTYEGKPYYLYFGRLSKEKGIFTLIKAAQKTGINLRIVGTGDMYYSLKDEVIKKKQSNIEFLGFRQGQELIDIVGNAKAVIIPSEWYENGPYSAIESLQMGKPIIGSNIGGIPELVIPDKNGYIFESKNSDALAKCIEKMEKLSLDEYKAMEKYSEKVYKEGYTGKIHYSSLIDIYKRTMSMI